jgi:hypothetical protein
LSSFSQLKAIAAEFVARDAEAEGTMFATFIEFHGTVAAGQKFVAEKTIALDDAFNHDAPSLDPD